MEIFKKPLLLLFLPILVSCTASISPDISGEKKNSEDIHGERDILFAVTIEEEEDPGLALYRNPTTRLDVLDFYSNTIGNERIATAILHQAEKNNIPLNLAFALAWAESSYNPWAYNDNWGLSSDRGLFQLNSESFPFLSEQECYDPETNAHYGLQYLSSCLDRGGNEIVALAMYNAGSYRVEEWGTPLSTLEHINRILDYRAQLNEEFFMWMENRPSLNIAWNLPVVDHISMQ